MCKTGLIVARLSAKRTRKQQTRARGNVVRSNYTVFLIFIIFFFMAASESGPRPESGFYR